jgi:hypothetical protein
MSADPIRLPLSIENDVPREVINLFSGGPHAPRSSTKWFAYRAIPSPSWSGRSVLQVIIRPKPARQPGSERNPQHFIPTGVPFRYHHRGSGPCTSGLARLVLPSTRALALSYAAHINLHRYSSMSMRFFTFRTCKESKGVTHEAASVHDTGKVDLCWVPKSCANCRECYRTMLVRVVDLIV